MTSPGDKPIDLRVHNLEPGAAVDLRIPLTTITLRLGGQEYVVEDAAEARLSASRSLSGVHLHLRASGRLTGPCWRCLDPASVPVAVNAREFAAEGRDPDARFDDDLDSVYVEDDRVDVAVWVRDGIAEAVPPIILCRPDCAGLCPTCGTNLNEGVCDCARAQTDSRWGALREIADQMGLAED